MRRMEMAADSLYKAKMIRGFCHLAIGQVSYLEAVSVGLVHGINKNNKVITSYRCHPLAVLRGGTIRDVSLGAGIAFAQEYTEEATCTFAMYGDGAANQDQVVEAFDITRLWNLPCVFRSSSSMQYSTHGDKTPGFQARRLVLIFSMSDPGSIYRTREEVQRMRSMQDIHGLQCVSLENDKLTKTQSRKSPITF
ncbi:MAG: thiamine diphosphate-binding protein [Lentinula lateritia]|nr:MAG: thiamine diphosphate-binding protein [Lentinula lateritia]